MSNKDNLRHFDIQEPDPDETTAHKWLPRASAAVLVMVLGGAAWGLVQMMSGTAAPHQPRVQQISIVLPPPPPPPPPRMEEPEPELEEMKLEEPDPVPLADDSAEAPQELGLDADGVAGSDGFGLKARKGGRGLLGSGDPHAWYAGVLQRELQTLLSNNETVRGLGEYAVVISLSLSDDGHIENSQLLSGTNNPELDAALRRALAAGVLLSRQAPPDDLPQPIRLRITSRI